MVRELNNRIDAIPDAVPFTVIIDRSRHGASLKEMNSAGEIVSVFGGNGMLNAVKETALLWVW